MSAQRRPGSARSPYDPSPRQEGHIPMHLRPKSGGKYVGGSSGVKNYTSRLLADVDADQELQPVTASMIRQLQQMPSEYEPLHDGISEAGTEADEMINVDDEEIESASEQYEASSAASASPPVAAARHHRHRGRAPRPSEGSAATSQGGGVSEMDELSMLLADTPLAKIKAKQRQAEQLAKVGDGWGVLRLRQEILGLAKVQTTLYKHELKRYPMLLPAAHYKLAKAYSELGCVPQTTEHCQRAMSEMPVHGRTDRQVQAFESRLHVLTGEALLAATAPKPQLALQHFVAAAGVEDINEVKDLSIRVLLARCYAMMGEGRLEEARNTRAARVRLEEKIGLMREKVGSMKPKDLTKSGLEVKLADAEQEMADEGVLERKLLQEAEEKLDAAVVAVYDSLMKETDRLKEELGDNQALKHPLRATLSRLLAELSWKLSSVYSLKGDKQQQLISLNEVWSFHADNPGCVPLPLVVNVLKEKGAVLVERREYEKAEETYTELMNLQAERYEDNSAKQVLAQAECMKLFGNVYLAQKAFGRAKEQYIAALELFARHLGPSHVLVTDLEHRLNELRAYLDVRDVR